MGRGRGTAAIACLLGASALVAGCGASRHPNQQRPQPPTRVSVSITPRGIEVQPGKVAFGPEPKQQIPQNQNHPQPPIRTGAPLDVTFVAANQTTVDSHLVIRGARDADSEPVLAHSPGSFQVELPTGSYVIAAAGLPRARPGRLLVGPYRASSQNDVLLP
jgi:hypothetical protein